MEYTLAGKTLLDYINLFSANDYKKNDKMIKMILRINMSEEASLAFQEKSIDETRNYFSDEIKYNDLMGEKYKKTCKCLNYIEQFFILVSTVTGCVSVSAFILLVCVPVDNTSSAVGINICAITARIKKPKSIIKRKKKEHDKIVLLGKDKLNTIEVLISKALINSCISHDEFVSVNNFLREYNEMKEYIKNPETSVEYII